MKRRAFLAAGLACAASPALANGAPSAVVRLVNDQWAVEIDPRNFAISVRPAGRASITMSRGVASHLVSALKADAGAASWRWGEGFEISCTLAGPDLDIRIIANAPGELALLDQPGEAMGKGLMMPIGEGYYIAADDARWHASLSGDERSINEDFSLPLWGFDHGDFTLHWLFANPFNTMARFATGPDGLAVALNHSFTTLAPATPMKMLLHLGGPDLLAGARRYRRHLIEQGDFRSLADKIGATPSAAKLIGATHLYLWDNGLIGVKDVRDWPGLLDRLRNATGQAARIRARFGPDIVELIRTSPPRPAPYAQRAIVNAFNAALIDLARAQWQKEEVDPVAIVAAHTKLREEAVAAFGPVLAGDAAHWGASLSPATFTALGAAGLERLWIGLGDGWEGGLWHPEAVRAAAAQGYLIGPYDSYETAIPPGQRPDWSTAQLGRAAYDRCGVVKANGTITAGFQQTGHYTNTRCVTPILKARIPPLAKAGGYNSWFLDVYATGMVFDDHRPGATMTMAENAAANVAAMRWVSEALQLPQGSEGGNAIAAAGTIFAHGIETPGFGWGDQDLRKNKDSPFFLGGWYPADAPTVFFKPVPLKEPYRTLYFDPRTRLPLYQAVFHDSVIATHQWAFDQLKLANVVADRALMQQLYNLPPLFHLSAGTLADRLPAILRHDAFFRPLHQRLAHQAMVGFEWLSEDRLVQRTSFADGTQLVANFADVPRAFHGLALPSRSVTAIIDGHPARVFEASGPLTQRRSRSAV
ncbi:MAG: glycoside hydrolase [Sphingomonas sp.]